MEFGISSFDDMLQGLHIDNLLVTLLLATFVPFLIRTVIYFFTVTWPNFVHFLVVKLILRREVIGAPMNLDKLEQTEKKWVHNDLLVQILLTYVSHRLQQRHVLLEDKLALGTLQKGKCENYSLEEQKRITRKAIDESKLSPPLFAQLELMPSPVKLRKYANGCQKQREKFVTESKHQRDKLSNCKLTSLLEESSSELCRSNVHDTTLKEEYMQSKQSEKSELRQGSGNGDKIELESSRECEVNNITLSANPVLRSILLNEYTISTMPASGIAVEVEPGLFVRYISSKTTWNKFIKHSLSDTQSHNVGAGESSNGIERNSISNKLKANSQNNRTAEKGATIRETYLLHDLLQKLRFWPRGSCPDNQTSNTTTTNTNNNTLFNNVGPFGNNVEDSWWSKMLSVNFGWNNLLFGWFGADVNDSNGNNDNWNDNNNDNDNDDDDDEVRALEEERKQGYIARQIIIESVRVQPVSLPTDVHSSVLQSLWHATPFSLLYAIFIALCNTCIYTYQVLCSDNQSETSVSSKKDKEAKNKSDNESTYINANIQKESSKDVKTSTEAKSQNNEWSAKFKERWRLLLVSWFESSSKSTEECEQEAKEKRRECKKEALARIDQFIDDAVKWYKENCDDERRKRKVCYLIYPVLRPPPSLLRTLLLGNPFISSLSFLEPGHCKGDGLDTRYMDKMQSEGCQFDMGFNYSVHGSSMQAMMKRAQHARAMKSANNGFGGHGNNYHINIKNKEVDDNDHNNKDDDDNNDNDDNSSKESKSHDDENDSSEDDNGERKIRRYPLPRRHGKTFQTLFFHHKEKVIQLLDSFVNRQGKFAIRGSAHKMTWLLYGPPGTGKTSLVKAMAQYLQRHVVIINLAAIRNFHELQDWMHNPLVKVENETIHSEDSESDESDFDDYDVCFNADRAMYKRWRREERQRKRQCKRYGWRNRRFPLTAKSVIYLLEDVDAVNVEDITINPATNTATTTTAAAKSENDHCGTMNTEKIHETGNDASINTSEVNQVQVERVMIKSRYDMGHSGKLPGAKKANNGLSINDLVRVLTNPVAPSGRFVILTTNHIENVHPLLLRLNVIDDRIMMSYVNTSDAQKIIEHYYQCALTRQQVHELEVIAEHISQRVQDAFCKSKQHRTSTREFAQRDNALSLLHTSSLSVQYNGFSPASLEQMCAEQETVEDLLRTMQSKYFETDNRDDLEVF